MFTTSGRTHASDFRATDYRSAIVNCANALKTPTTYAFSAVPITIDGALASYAATLAEPRALAL
jgi:hypothetical protein